MNEPIFITGCPRSGTSLTARVFEACGAWAGHTTSQCENRALRETLLKPMLGRAGMDKLGLASWVDVDPDDVDAESLRERILGIVFNQGYSGGPWLYKDAKLVFAWRAWAAAFPRAIWVTVWRPREAILDSFDRWPMSRQHDFIGERVVDEHHDRARKIEGALPVFPDRLLRDRDDEAYRVVAAAAGLRWDLDAAMDAIDPSMYHVS